MRKSFYALVLILILCAIVYFLVVSKEKKTFAPQRVEHFLQFDSSSVDKIKFSLFQTKRIFEKKDENWYSTHPDSFKLDKILVGQFLNLMANLEVEDLISANPVKQMRFQVDTLTGTRIDFFNREKLLASLVVGKTSSDYMYTYVRKSNSKEVWSAKGFLSPLVSRRLDQWRDKSIIELDAEKIQKVEFVRNKGSFWLIKADTLWKVSPPPYSASYEVKEDKVEDFIKFISSFKADAFVSKKEALKLDMGKSVLQLRLVLEDGSGEILTVFREGGESERYFAKKGEDETIYEFSKGSYELIDKRVEDFKSED